ncbi:hypothetical protein C8R43DRAFT_1241007 [Mycena crocata]|nr:hypothetical protein C8R43DRAFT_1241007 [Mycena crocata]
MSLGPQFWFKLSSFELSTMGISPVVIQPKYVRCLQSYIQVEVDITVLQRGSPDRRSYAPLLSGPTALEAAKTAHPSKKLIPRPKGQAGKGITRGYTLRKAMRLQKNPTRYNRLSRIVRFYANRFLKTAKTIKDQDPAMLEKVIAVIKKDVKYFQRFQGGWPIRDFIKQYLVNLNGKFKRSLRDEQAAEADDPDEWNDTDLSDDEASNINNNAADDSDMEDIAINFDAEDNDAAEEQQDDAGPKNDLEDVLPASPEKENISPSRPKPTPLNFTRHEPETPKKRKNKGTIVASTLDQRPTKKQKTDPNILPAINRSDIPNICPASYCKERVPEDLSASLMALFSEKRQLIHEGGPTALGCSALTKKICQALGEEGERTRRLTQAVEAGWPTTIDFDDLPARILSIFPELALLQSDSSLLAKSPVWKKVLKLIKYEVFAFTKSSARFKSAELGCGYFGPKGSVIIQETLKSFEQEEDVDNALYATLSELVDKPSPWDQFDDSSNLISPKKFSEFILIPHIAASLISQDLEISLSAAVEVLEDSANYGTLFNGDIPEKVDIIVTPDAVSSEQPPRHRKGAVKLTLPKPKVITLEDFPAPVSKDKKKPKAPVEKTVKKPSQKPKTKAEKKEKELIKSTHTYGTRGSGK